MFPEDCCVPDSSLWEALLETRKRAWYRRGEVNEL